jgi:hypothetical protein
MFFLRTEPMDPANAINSRVLPNKPEIELNFIGDSGLP